MGKEEKGLMIYTKVYDLIYELNKICPSVLLSVLPQLEVRFYGNWSFCVIYVRVSTKLTTLENFRNFVLSGKVGNQFIKFNTNFLIAGITKKMY